MREFNLSLLLLRLRRSAGEELLDELPDSLVSLVFSAGPTSGAVSAFLDSLVGDEGADSLPVKPTTLEAAPLESTESDP